MELHINGRLSTDSTEIANEFNRYFIQSVEELAICFEPIQLPQNAINDTPSSFYISEVDEDKISQIINQLNNSRAKDIFGMDTAFVKKYSACLLKPLVNLINVQWGKKVFSQPPIVQVLPLKKMREACNTYDFHHMYTSTMRDKIRKKNPENHIVGFLKNLFANYGGK